MPSVPQHTCPRSPLWMRPLPAPMMSRVGAGSGGRKLSLSLLQTFTSPDAQAALNGHLWDGIYASAFVKFP